MIEDIDWKTIFITPTIFNELMLPLAGNGIDMVTQDTDGTLILYETTNDSFAVNVSEIVRMPTSELVSEAHVKLRVFISLPVADVNTEGEECAFGLITEGVDDDDIAAVEFRARRESGSGSMIYSFGLYSVDYQTLERNVTWHEITNIINVTGWHVFDIDLWYSTSAGVSSCRVGLSVDHVGPSFMNVLVKDAIFNWKDGVKFFISQWNDATAWGWPVTGLRSVELIF